MRVNKQSLKLAIAVGVWMGFASLAQAQQIPDVAAGKERSKVCMSCHGENGVSRVPGVPTIAGQDRQYFIRSMLAYRSGELRQDPVMAALAKPLSDADIANIAAYWASVSPKPAQ